MMMTKTRLILLAGVATGIMMQPAMALDAQAFVDRVAEVYKTIGYDLTFGPATLDGDTVTVDGITIGLTTAPAEAGMEPIVIDTELTFSGVTEGADGSYKAASLTVPDIDTYLDEEQMAHLSLADIRVDGIYVPAGDTIPAAAILQLWQSASTGALSISRNDAEVISVSSIEASSTFNPEQGAAELADLHSTLAINDIWADLSTVGEEDASAGATIEALGLTEISGNITQDMTWSMADGHMTINEFLFDFDDIGALNIKADLTGLTPAVLDQLSAMQTAMAASGEASEEQAQAQMMSGMAIMQGVSIVGASVRYDDASLAGKLLDFFASQSGADRAGFVEGIKSMLPTLVDQAGIPALTAIVVPAVSAFLDNPQSLEVKIAPPSPTSALVLMAAAANPAGLITALGLAVTANQPAE